MNPSKLVILATFFVASSNSYAEDQTWISTLVPPLSLDFGAGQQIINLTPNPNSSPLIPRRSGSDPQSSTPEISAPREKAPTLLEQKNYAKGFRVVNNFDLSFGVGIENSFDLQNSTGLAQGYFQSVGILPIVGRTVNTVSYVKDLRGVKFSLLPRTLPKSASELRDWHSGDAIAFSSRGGILFTASAGISVDSGTFLGSLSVASVNATLLAQGEFKTYVEKLDRTHALVKITDTSLNSVGIQAGAIIVKQGISHYSKIADSLSYRFDLSTKAGAKAFAEMISGNVAVAQRTALLGSDVQLFEKKNVRQSGNLNSFFFGIPLVLHTNLSAGKLNELDFTQSFRANTLLKSHYGIYLNEQSTRAFTIKKKFTEAFYGASYRVENTKSRVLNKGHFAQYFWSFDRNETSQDSLNSMMHEITKKTGLGSLLKLKAPNSDDLGYTSVSLRAHFDETNLKHSMRTASRMSKEKILNAVNSMIEYYLSGSHFDADGICANYSGECSMEAINETAPAIAQMYDAMIDLGSAMSADDNQAFADASARFGKAMMVNRFTFQTAILLAGAGVKLDYIVEGRDVSRYLLTADSTKNPGRLFVRSKRSLITEGSLYR